MPDIVPVQKKEEKIIVGDKQALKTPDWVNLGKGFAAGFFIALFLVFLMILIVKTVK